MISFVIPAYNEEALLGQTLDTLLAVAQAVGEPYEIIVVNDDSTDRTAEIAAARGVRVITVRCRQISAVRNAGAREAKGEFLFFLDADTLMTEPVLRDALAALRAGAVGGGARVKVDATTPWAARVFVKVFALFYFGMRWAAGCSVFARREAFEQAGGFDVRYYVSEEVHLSRRLKRLGRFVILRSAVITSGRKLRMYTVWRHAGLVIRFLLRGPASLRRREGLEMWYSGEREHSP